MHSQLYTKIEQIVRKFSESQQEISEDNFDSENFKKLINEQDVQVECQVSSCSFWQVDYSLSEGNSTGSPDLKIQVTFKHLEEDLVKNFSVHGNRETSKKLENVSKIIDFNVFESMKKTVS